jgi:hypothetical protein
MKLETDNTLVRDNLSRRGPNNFRYFMDGIVVPSSDYIPIHVYNCVILELGYLHETKHYWRHGIFCIFKVLQSDVITQ